MNSFIEVSAILSLQDQLIHQWKMSDVILQEAGFLRIVEENHAFNYQLWHAEDKARRDDLGHEFVYLAKRQIDQYNQQRNDRMEKIDDYIFTALSPAVSSDCALHSETPGMIIDRLSILALKIYHMKLQAERITADESHRMACHEKYMRLSLQRNQLAVCLDEFIHQIIKKLRTFTLYRQFKMYNDKDLNPELY